MHAIEVIATELSRRAGAVDVLSYPDDSQKFGAKIGALTGDKGVTAVFDGVGKSTFDASLASLEIPARWRYSVPPADLSPLSTPNGSMPLVRSI